MSIYKECSAAARRLTEGTDEARDTRIEVNLGDVFTELDVVIEASKKSWTKADFKAAQKRANLLLTAQYRASKLVRFGPVSFNGVEDYARIGNCLVYASPDKAPERWESPNGAFPQIRYADDSLLGTGRRRGSTRDDAVPWPEPLDEDQDQTLEKANKRIEELEQECERLRSHSADENGRRTWTREEIASVVEERVQARLGQST